MICVQRHVALAARALGEAFLTRTSETSLAQFACHYPDIAAGHILECELGGHAGTVDYSLALLPGAAEASKAPVQGPVATVLDGFCSGALSAAVLWLEHDMATDGGMSPPSVFLAPVRDATGAAAEQVAQALCTALWPGQRCPSLQQVMRHLPAGGFVKQIGAMAGRDGLSAPVLRLVIDGIAPEAVSPLLAALGWPGRDAAADDIAGLTTRHLRGGLCRVDLDLGAALAPSLGVELPASGLTAVPELAADLSAQGLCAQAKAGALVALAARHGLTARDPDSPVERLDFGLNHVKLSVTSGDVDQKIRAKAYFSLVTTPDFAGTDLPWRADQTAGA